MGITRSTIPCKEIFKKLNQKKKHKQSKSKQIKANQSRAKQLSDGTIRNPQQSETIKRHIESVRGY